MLSTRVLQARERSITRLNQSIKRLGINVEIYLAERWSYQLLKYKLGN